MLLAIIINSFIPNKNSHQKQTVQDDYNPTILDFWVAIDSTVGAGASQQLVLGYEEYIGSSYKIQVEGYYKNLQNMLTFVETRASTDEQLSDEQVSDNFAPSDGSAYGLEVFTQKATGWLNGWLAYT